MRGQMSSEKLRKNKRRRKDSQRMTKKNKSKDLKLRDNDLMILLPLQMYQ
jgi:hypothetical protein